MTADSTFPSGAQPAIAPATHAVLSPAFEAAVRKIRTNIVLLADAPKSAAFAEDGNYFAFHEGFNEIGNWTSSFFTGMALLAFEATRDPHFLHHTERLAPAYRDKLLVHGMDTMHDLGFLYSLYSVALHRITGAEAHRAVGLYAADALAGRFHPGGGFLQAWGRMDDRHTEYRGLAIIDCLMNLPLLFWASRETGSARYLDIAVRHADTTLRHFVRADDSVFHAYRFDPGTGAPLAGDNYCGFDTGSHWARGTTWAIYGFALAHRHTCDPRYLDASRRIAHRYLSLLDADLVPVWDFRLPEDQPRLRDASAAAVAVCGLDELARHCPGEPAFAAAAERILKRLCAPDLLDAGDSCRGLLRNAQVGAGRIEGRNAYRARNVYTSWGDYYLMEALARRLRGLPGYW